MNPVVIIRHESWINAGFLSEYLQKNKIPVKWVKIDQGEKVPVTLDKISGLVFLGGTMSVNDPLPWIEDELNLIQLAAKEKLPVIGHCLGSQLISKAMGGTVAPMKAKEIGWHKIKPANNSVAQEWFSDLPNLPESYDILLWHHEEFTIPVGAYPLYASQHCENQAFIFDNMLATVGHIECSAPMLQEWLEVYGHDINPVCQSTQALETIKQGIPEKIFVMHQLSERFYSRWIKQLDCAG